MAKTKSTSAGSNEALRAAAARVESQRTRLFGVIGVIGVIGCAREALGEELEPGEPDIQAALDVARSILDDMCNQLDPMHFERLAQASAEVAHG